MTEIVLSRYWNRYASCSTETGSGVYPLYCLINVGDCCLGIKRPKFESNSLHLLASYSICGTIYAVI